MLDTLKMKVSMEGAWTVSGGKAFQTFTLCGKKENCGPCGRHAVERPGCVLLQALWSDVGVQGSRLLPVH